MFLGIPITSKERFLLGALIFNSTMAVLNALAYKAQLRKALEVIDELQASREYMISLLNKYHVPVDEFDAIALKFHHVTTIKED